MKALRLGVLTLPGVLAVAPAGADVRLRMIHGRPVVDGVFVNGNGPHRFLLDTGTQLNMLEPELARSLGLASTFRTDLVSSTGVIRVEGTEGIDVSIGSAQAGSQVFLFAGLDAIQRIYPDVRGVLGQGFLSRFDYRINPRAQQIEFGKHEPGAARTRVPFQTVSGRPVVATSLGSLVLDSGANRVTLFNVESRDLTHQVITMTGSVSIGTVPRTLVIDGRTVWRGDAAAIPRPAETGANGLLPLSLFKTVYVCNSEGYVVLD